MASIPQWKKDAWRKRVRQWSLQTLADQELEIQYLEKLVKAELEHRRKAGTR